jgi:hypothetical protein
MNDGLENRLSSQMTSSRPRGHRQEIELKLVIHFEIQESDEE